ncbi:MAG: hypothetical protein HYU44_15900 [Betaproteobacteria bacterium]|nr:hypothetical protein [Betaproteobacteria bacterium]
MHDTVEFEKRGIPATLFLTGAFTNAAIHQFRGKGMDGHPCVSESALNGPLFRRILARKWTDPVCRENPVPDSGLHRALTPPTVKERR